MNMKLDAETYGSDKRLETEKLAIDEQIYLPIKASHTGAIFLWLEKLKHKSKTKRIPPSSRWESKVQLKGPMILGIINGPTREDRRLRTKNKSSS